LGMLAKENGGAYVVAGNGNDDMKKLAEVIHAKYQMQGQGEVKIRQRTEYFYFPLAFSLLLLLIGFSSLPRFKGERKQGRVSDRAVGGLK